MYPILIATKITNREVINARVFVERNFRFNKFPNCPPIKTANNKKKYSFISIKFWFLVSWPIIPNIEFIKINKETAVVICLGFAALNKYRMGPKKIPPPIPTIPETNPKITPIKNEKYNGKAL